MTLWQNAHFFSHHYGHHWVATCQKISPVWHRLMSRWVLTAGGKFTDSGTIPDSAHFLPLHCVLWDQIMHEEFVGKVISCGHIVWLVHSGGTYKAYCTCLCILTKNSHSIQQTSTHTIHLQFIQNYSPINYFICFLKVKECKKIYSLACAFYQLPSWLKISDPHHGWSNYNCNLIDM